MKQRRNITTARTDTNVDTLSLNQCTSSNPWI